MKATIEIEQTDYLKAITPFRNGCSFRALFEPDGRVLLEPGCYLLVNLVQGADRVFLDWWRANNKKPFAADVTPETIMAMKAMRTCSWCGGSLHNIKEPTT